MTVADSAPRLPKGPPPFGTILRPSISPSDPKVFLKASYSPIYTNFRLGARAEKQDFMSKLCKKSKKKTYGPSFQ